MTDNDAKNNSVFSQQTPITAALAIAICAGAFWVGQTTQSLQSQITHEKEVQVLRDAGTKEYRQKTAIIIDRLTDIVEELRAGNQ